ncbi:MAG: hypothetical protein ABI680_02245 [Chthoniobacteraceae bacterium]
MKTNLKIVKVALSLGALAVATASAGDTRLQRVGTPNGGATFIYRPADRDTPTVALYREGRGVGSATWQRNSVVKLKRVNLPNGGQRFIYRTVEERSQW